MRFRSLITLAVSLAGMPVPACFGLDPRFSIHQYHCESWGRHDGFPANQVADIEQTRDGYIWFSTQDGLVRFDGASFLLLSVTNFPVNEQRPIGGLLADPNGGLWFTLQQGGIGFHDGQNTRFLSQSQGAEYLFPSRSEGLWVSVYTQLARVSGDRLEILEDFGSKVIAIRDQAEGRVWVGTTAEGLFYWDGQQKHAVLPGVFKNKIIYAVAIDREGNVWVATNFGIFCIRPDMTLRPLENAFPGMVTCLLVDRAGVPWFGTKDAGVFQFKNNRFDSLKEDEGLANNAVNALFEDREGSMWIATRNGFSQLIDQKFPTFARGEGLKGENVSSIQSGPGGDLYVSSEGAVHVLEGSTFRELGQPEGLSSTWIDLIQLLPDGRLVCASHPKTALVYQPGHATSVIALEEMMTFAAEDARGILIGDGKRFLRLENDRLVPYQFTDVASGEFGWPSTMISRADGTVWGGYPEGLRRIRDGEVTLYQTPQGLVNDQVRSLTPDADGSLWIATQGGISRLRNEKFENCTAADGLFADNVRAIIPDNSGHLWMNSPRGIFSMSRASFEAFAAGHAPRVECTAYLGADVVKGTEIGYQQQDEG